MRNSQCQDRFSVMSPPTIGPVEGAITATMPASTVAMPCSVPGLNSRKTAANTSGISTPAAMPCSTRKPTSIAKPVLMAQPIEASGEHDDRR